EQVAEAAERELVKLKLLGYLSQHIGMNMEAVVTGVEDFGLFVQGLELPADGLVHIDGLPEDHYQHDPQTHTLSGHRRGNQFRLGDKLQVEVNRVDLNRRQLDFKFIKPLTSSRLNSRSSRRPSKPRQGPAGKKKKKSSKAKKSHGQTRRKKKSSGNKRRRSR
ncbi:MAG: S1 RNA-binding domain-containing protein, partial [Planctomycetota bacterium]|nr:S1 RNA-binding domain-containing protein [Planctomycetota bacterium]